MKENEKMKIIKNDFLTNLIKRVTGRYSSFEDLRWYELNNVLKKIIDNDLMHNLFGKRGYDIISQKFFVVVYIKEKAIHYNDDRIVEFSNFSSFYEYIDGEIYEQSCFYGYPFTKEEIKKYRIKLKKLNHDSFIDYDIDKYTFEYLKNKEEIDINHCEGKQVNKKELNYTLSKSFSKKYFIIKQSWADEQGYICLQNIVKFKLFFDFVHFLKGDLSNADLLMCDGLENIRNVKGLNINGIHVRSEVAKALKLEFEKASYEMFDLKEFDETSKYELETKDMYLQIRNDINSIDKIAYISDIHLEHRYSVNHCVSWDDLNYINNKIADEINNKSSFITLIGGDIASSFKTYKIFINLLSSICFKRMFFTLGNHELWPFNEDLNSIIKEYREFLSKKKMYLVHNNIYYYEDYEFKEVEAEELEYINEEELRNKMRRAKLIIFGGIGFSGKNNVFNANFGIYRNTINRNQEIEESEKFEKLYIKVSKALYDKNVIIFTHMPMKEWSNLNYTDGFVYVSGHNHKNEFYDDGKKRIYADNQVGYKQKDVFMKHFSISMNYDWFSDYKDGIYKIKRDDYDYFCRGQNIKSVFNREFEKLFMMKRENNYMFFMTAYNNKLYTLNGGAIFKANHNLEYYFEHINNYVKSIKLYLAEYSDYQRKISNEIKAIGGCGDVHGTIVDIDFYNHLYINPLDGSITPYFANTIVEKYVYKNVASLLQNECPSLYSNYEKYIINNENEKLSLINKKDIITKEREYVTSTKMYEISRIIKGLQYTLDKNVVRIWNDQLIENASKDNGKQIIVNLLDDIKE